MESKISYNKTQKTNFTQVPNEILNSTELSWGAKGLWAYMAGKPEGWKFTIRLMASQCGDSIKSTTSKLNELLEKGYVEREVIMKKTGKQCLYSIFEKPRCRFGNLQNGNLQNGTLEYSNKYLSNKEKSNKEKIISKEIMDIPLTNPVKKEKAVLGNTSLEGSSQGITDNKASEKKLQKENYEPNPPNAAAPPSRRKTSKKELWEREFEEIWQYCPNKRGKADGRKAYQRARKNGVEMATILEGMKKYAERVETEKTPKQYIRQGGNWFKGERWEDEMDFVDDGNDWGQQKLDG